MERADEGQILVNGEVILTQEIKISFQYPSKENQLNFGLVFQSFNLFPQYNVLENVELAPKLWQKSEMIIKKTKEILASIESEARADGKGGFVR